MAVHEIHERPDGIVEEFHAFKPGELESVMCSCRRSLVVVENPRLCVRCRKPAKGSI